MRTVVSKASAPLEDPIARWRALCINCLLILVASPYPMWAMAQKHPFAVKDSIEMTRFSDPNELSADATAKYSPDGRHFVCVTTRGLLSSNKVESTIWTFNASEVRTYLNKPDTSHKPRPIELARFAVRVSINAVYPYAPTIEDLRWTTDSRAILFLVQTATGKRRLYRAVLLSRNVTPLSPADADVQRYDSRSGIIAYTTALQSQERQENHDVTLYGSGAVAATGLPLSQLLFSLKSSDAGDCELWAYRNGTSHRLRSLTTCWPSTVSIYTDPFAISPDGHSLTWLMSVDQPPKKWESYSAEPTFAGGGSLANNERRLHPFHAESLRQYGVINLLTGKTEMLLDAPLADAYGYFGARQAVWSANGRRLLVTDTFLPLFVSASGQQKDRTHPCLVAVLDTLSRATDCVVSEVPEQYATTSYGPFHLAKVSWESNDQDASAVYRNTHDNKVERYVREGERWNPAAPTSTDAIGMPDKSAVGNPVISIKQSFDDGPPTLWAKDVSHARGVKLWDPNPQFSNMSFGKASLWRWTDSAGAHWIGGLVLPVGYVSGNRYPLVIQTHGLWDKLFMTDGVFPTAMAARPLASAGFVVLQIGIVDADQHTGTPREASDAVLGIEAAIDQLTSDGLIDPKRVGITGFSRTCWHVENALVHDPERFAAAILADGIDEGYMQYLLFSDGKDTLRREFERINGGPPFAQNLSTWMQSSATFHLDQVNTPIRLEAHGPESLLGEWQIYSSLRLQQKPVDFLYFHGEQHILQNPLDRMVSQQGAVDWFRFWLQGYEDSDPSKALQYKRWDTISMGHDRY